MNMHEWAIKWRVPAVALYELQQAIGADAPPLPAPPEHADKSEAFVSSLVKLRASQAGIVVTRNNVGALIPKDSKRPVRFGLFNESEAMNDLLKSSDLIGWRPVTITAGHVGFRIAQFWARECKAPDWQYTATEHEVAQKVFIDMVNRDGGDAAFTTGVGL